MLIGSGLIARAFSGAPFRRPGLWIYAAGVSNSGCRDEREFARERARLEDALAAAPDAEAFVYFGTCSVADPEARETPYVRHKLAMEALVRAHPRHVVLRLPQVAGLTPNPHTLLNFLHARVSRSEAFELWSGARRNIVDVADAAAIAAALLASPDARGAVFAIANDTSYAMPEIVAAMEAAVGKRAVCSVVARGSGYAIDTASSRRFREQAGVRFDAGYLERVVAKYYGGRVASPPG